LTELVKKAFAGENSFAETIDWFFSKIDRRSGRAGSSQAEVSMPSLETGKPNLKP